MTVQNRIALALAGVGKIARDQHLPAVANGRDFALVAAISHHGKVANT
jgi:predicted dehydrogenase